MAKREDVRELARQHHEKLLREDPKYREAWEKVTALWFTVLADTELPDDQLKR